MANNDIVMLMAKQFASHIEMVVTENPKQARMLTWFTPKAMLNEQVKEMASQPTITIE